MTTTRIGLFGGTFDPPHLGHEVVARQARAILGLDRMLWMVANDPWQKTGQRAPSPASVRLEMVRAAVAELDDQVACSLEIDRGGPTYTIDTVAELEARVPGAELVLVLGRDTAAGLPGWHRAEELSRAGRRRVRRPTRERGSRAARSGGTWSGWTSRPWRCRAPTCAPGSSTAVHSTASSALRW